MNNENNSMKYKHTQIGYLMLCITLVVSLLFIWIHVTASLEPASVDAGPNFPITAMMFLILLLLASFWLLQVVVDKKYLRIKFGYGIFKKNFLLNEIISVKAVKNHWYYGWGIRVWLWPKMWIYNISGFDAVEIKMRNGKTFRIGTDESEKLEQAVLDAIKINIKKTSNKDAFLFSFC
jgi:hypothetical protein